MATWGEYYHAIASQMALYRESNRRLCQLAELKPGMTVVDLGAGSGLTSLAALDQVPEGLRLILIDASAVMIDEARRHLGDRVEAYHVADAAAGADLITEKVDRLLCNMSIWSFGDPEAVLRAWRSKIKSTGRFCFNYSGTYFNTRRDWVTPQFVLIQELHRRGELSRGLPPLDRMPNQRSIEGTLKSVGYKPFSFEAQEIASQVPETEPGGELHSLMRLTPALPAKNFRDAVARSLAALQEAADAIAAENARWLIAHFTAQPSLSPDEILMEKFGGRLPG